MAGVGDGLKNDVLPVIETYGDVVDTDPSAVPYLFDDGRDLFGGHGNGIVALQSEDDGDVRSVAEAGLGQTAK